MNLSDEFWLTRLRSTGAERDDALRELRDVLLLRLRRSFQHRAGVVESLLDDIVQEALLKTLAHLDQFQGRSRFTTWSTAIAVRVAFTELRRQRWNHVSLDQLRDETPIDAHELAESPLPESDIVQQAMIDEMYRIIDTELTEKQRSALLAELQGMPLEEIGRRMGSNRNAIYKLTHDARQRLRQGLEKAGYSLADVQTV